MTPPLACTRVLLSAGGSAEPRKQGGPDLIQSLPGEGTPGGNTSRMEQADAHTGEPAKPYGMPTRDTLPAAEGVAEAPPCGAPGVPPAGGLFSNTPPQASKTKEKTGDTTGGEDWLEMSVCVDWGANYVSLHKGLRFAKEAAQDERMAREGGDLVAFGEWAMIVAPGGASCGVYFAFRLAGHGVVVLLQDRQKPKAEVGNVIVRFDGTACLQWGGFGCLERARALLVAMGGLIIKEKLSRVDMALDVSGVGMEAFDAAYREERHIMQAKKRRRIEENGAITLYFGKAPLMLRIYDKAAEIRESCDETKRFLMLLHRWQTGIPKQAIRVEFELRREALKERGIDTPDDYFLKRADLAAYLCSEWVRFTASAVDRDNTVRAAVLPHWQAVADGFKRWTGERKGLPLMPLEPGQVDVRQLEKQGVGALLTALVLSGNAVSKKKFAAYCQQARARFLAGVNWKREVARRMV